MFEFFKSKDKTVFNKIIMQGVSLFFLLFTLVYFFHEYFPDPNGNSPWVKIGLLRHIILMLLFISMVWSYAYYRAAFGKKVVKRDSMSRFFFWGIRVIILILLVLGAMGVYLVLDSETGSSAIFKSIGLGIVTVWSCVFLAYFIWAIYYYNINMGLTDEEWKKIDEAKEDKRLGNFYNQDDIDEEPKYNPYADQTFGLPSGTVRGMIAFTLLFGAIAMLVVSFGMTNEIDPNSFFWDQYDFYKDAFLMMIAFYFGSRSLQYLKEGNTPVKLETVGSTKSPNPANNPPDHSKATGKEEMINAGDINPMESSSEAQEPVEEQQPTVKTAKADDDFSSKVNPMNP